MIADFIYDPRPGKDVIAVCLVRRLGAPNARLVIPETVRLAFADDCPSDAELLSLASALACGVFIAAKSRMPLRISGDLSVWPAEWGVLGRSRRN